MSSLRLVFSLTALVYLAAPAIAVQPPEVPEIPAAEEVAKEDPLDGEPSVSARVSKDVSALSDAFGEFFGESDDEDAADPSEGLSDALDVMLDPAAEDQARLDAAASARKLMRSLNGADAAQSSLYRQLNRRILLVERGVGALKAGEVQGDGRALLNELIVRLGSDYENTLRKAHANAARDAYRALKYKYPAIHTAIRPVVMEHYFNYNLHFVLSEPILAKILSDNRRESGGIADCILGAWVTGTQTTDTNLRVDIKPSSSQAHFNILVDGHTTSNTAGRKSPATIYSRGNHHFSIVKPTYFDGRRISSGAANMDVNANNTTVGVSTNFDGIPILGGIARKIAAKEAAKKELQGEAIAARKLADKALPRFEQEVGNKFAEANSTLERKLLGKLRSKGIEPEQFSARSSDTHVALSSRTLPIGMLSAPVSPFIPAPQRGIAVQLHESALSLAIDTLGISGELTVEEVLTRIETGIADLIDKPISLERPETDGEETRFDFTEKDAIRVRLDEGKVIIILRTGFYQVEKDRRIPKHIFEIPLEIALVNGQLQVVPPKTDPKGILSLKPQAIKGRSSIRSVAQARGIAKELLENTFKEPTIQVDTAFDLPLENGGILNLRVTTFDISDGWMTVVFE